MDSYRTLHRKEPKDGINWLPKLSYCETKKQTSKPFENGLIKSPIGVIGKSTRSHGGSIRGFQMNNV